MLKRLFEKNGSILFLYPFVRGLSKNAQQTLLFVAFSNLYQIICNGSKYCSSNCSYSCSVECTS